MHPSILRKPAEHASAPGFFLDQAIYLARASELAYDDDAGWIARSLGVAHVTTFPDPTLQPLPNTQGFWFRHEGLAILVFRGSANRQHWLRNFKVLPPKSLNHPWGTVHPGFSASLQSVIPSVLESFAFKAAGEDIVWLSGHSLGGALAVLASAWPRIQTGVQPYLRTYGQPMAGFFGLPSQVSQRAARPPHPFHQSNGHRPSPPRSWLRALRGRQDHHPRRRVAGFRCSRRCPATDRPRRAPCRCRHLGEIPDHLEQADDIAFNHAQFEGMLPGRLPWFAHHSMTEYVLQLQKLRAKLP